MNCHWCYKPVEGSKVSYTPDYFGDEETLHFHTGDCWQMYQERILFPEHQEPRHATVS